MTTEESETPAQIVAPSSPPDSGEPHVEGYAWLTPSSSKFAASRKMLVVLSTAAAVLLVALALLVVIDRPHRKTSRTNTPRATPTPDAAFSTAALGLRGYVWSTRDGAMFIQWTEVGSTLSGTFQVSVRAPENDSGIFTLGGTISGVRSDKSLTLTLTEVIGAALTFTNSLAGTLDDSALTLYRPDKASGTITPIVLHVGTALEYNQAVIALKPAIIGISGQTNTPDTAATNSFTVDYGVYIIQVLGDTPAARAGLQVNDVIVELAGRRVSTFDDLRRILDDFRPDEKLDVGFFRGRERRTVSLTLAPRPAPTATPTTAPTPTPVSRSIPSATPQIPDVRQVGEPTWWVIPSQSSYGATTYGQLNFGVMLENRSNAPVKVEVSFRSYQADGTPLYECAQYFTGGTIVTIAPQERARIICTTLYMRVPLNLSGPQVTVRLEKATLLQVLLGSIEVTEPIFTTVRSGRTTTVYEASARVRPRGNKDAETTLLFRFYDNQHVQIATCETDDVLLQPEVARRVTCTVEIDSGSLQPASVRAGVKPE